VQADPTAISGKANDRHRDNPDSGNCAWQMHGDIETSLAKLNHMAAEVFNALMIDTAAAEYSAPKKDPA
jgi:hypothetical protein